MATNFRLCYIVKFCMLFSTKAEFQIQILFRIYKIKCVNLWRISWSSAFQPGTDELYGVREDTTNGNYHRFDIHSIYIKETQAAAAHVIYTRQCQHLTWRCFYGRFVPSLRFDLCPRSSFSHATIVWVQPMWARAVQYFKNFIIIIILHIP